MTKYTEVPGISVTSYTSLLVDALVSEGRTFPDWAVANVRKAMNNVGGDVAVWGMEALYGAGMAAGKDGSASGLDDTGWIACARLANEVMRYGWLSQGKEPPGGDARARRIFMVSRGKLGDIDMPADVPEPAENWRDPAYVSPAVAAPAGVSAADMELLAKIKAGQVSMTDTTTGQPVQAPAAAEPAPAAAPAVAEPAPAPPSPPAA